LLKGDSQRFRPFSRTKGGFSIPLLVILPNFGRLRLVLGKRGGGSRSFRRFSRSLWSLGESFSAFSKFFPRFFKSYKSILLEIVPSYFSSLHPDSFSSLGLCSWVFCLSGLFLFEVSIVFSLSGCLLAVQLYPIPLPPETEL
jgi:hypothetical protein